MLILTENQIHSIVFEEYNNLLIYTRKKFPFLKYNNIKFEEVVNESVISIFDCTFEFKSKEELLEFLHKTILLSVSRELNFKEGCNSNSRGAIRNKYIGGREMVQEKPGDYPFDIDISTDPVSSIIFCQPDFFNVYELFETARFGNNDEKSECIKCGSKRFYVFNQIYKCCACGRQRTIRSGTYLNSCKLSFKKLYLLIKTICSDPSVTSAYIARYCEITQKTAYYKALLIKSIIKHIDSARLEDVLTKLLTVVVKDDSLVIVQKATPKFSPEDVAEIRRLRKGDILKNKEISILYNTDPSTIAKITSHKIYNSPASIKKFAKNNEFQTTIKRETLHSDYVRKFIRNELRISDKFITNEMIVAKRLDIIKNRKRRELL